MPALLAKKQALLIGASGGLGSATIKFLSQKGWHIFAADNHQDIHDRFRETTYITPVFMDVTKPDTIEKARQLISAKTSCLDAVIHVAGILKIGSLAELPVSELEKALDINLLGVYRVNQLFLPMLLPEKGRIIILSSEVARQRAAPFNGIYTLSKYALEAYSDALRRELAFLGVKVIKIQPGPFKTDMTKNAEQLFVEARKNSVYFKDNLSKGISYLPKVYKRAHDPVRVARIIDLALESSRPKTAYTVKVDASRMLLDFLPVKWADKIIIRALS
jgi:NAD(P)-dependent dehydrogenase (short-subunit alcohol dehydrogenase family)